MMEPVEVLLVEDREEDAEMSMRELTKHNIANRIKWVEDGEEALEYLESQTVGPKLILLDLKLPKISGLEVLKKLRTFATTRKTPVVVMSSSREDNDIEKSYEYGVNSYIVKPVDFRKFSEVVKQLGLYWLVVNQPPLDRTKA